MERRRRRKRRIRNVLLSCLLLLSVLYIPSLWQENGGPGSKRAEETSPTTISTLLRSERGTLGKVTALLNSDKKEPKAQKESSLKHSEDTSIEGVEPVEKQVQDTGKKAETVELAAVSEQVVSKGGGAEENQEVFARARLDSQEQKGQEQKGQEQSGDASALTPKDVEPMKLAAIKPLNQASAEEQLAVDGADSAAAITSHYYQPYGLPNFSFLRTGLESEFANREFSKELQSTGLTTQGSQTSLYHYTIDEELQAYAEDLLQEYRVPWGAIVALEPQTGRVLAMASYTHRKPAADSENPGIQLALREGFPAASLFKVVTAAAAVERGGLQGDSVIRFRGGDYTLNKYNYAPNAKRDKRKTDLQTALAKSCNPAFARVALQHLSADILEEYAKSFGFNEVLPFDVSLPPSRFQKPDTDYSLARTAAGFANAEITPLHAAMVSAAMANRGAMMRPYVIEGVRKVGSNQQRGIPQVSQSYQARPIILKQAVLASTANRVNQMMVATVQEGTARRQFRRARSKRLRHMDVAAKTGTLSGKSPKGRYHWLIASAPAAAPEIAIATLVIDPGGARINGTGLGRKVLDYYFSPRPQQLEASAPRKSGNKASKKRG